MWNTQNLERTGNFTLKINDILYREQNVLKDIDLEQEIQITESDENILSIKPGFVSTTDINSIQVNLENKGTNDLEVLFNDRATQLKPADKSQIGSPDSFH